MKTPTPRTDAAALVWERDSHYIGTTVPADFARQLERELAAANALLREAAELLEEVRTGEDFEAVCWEHAEKCIAHLNAGIGAVRNGRAHESSYGYAVRVRNTYEALLARECAR